MPLSKIKMLKDETYSLLYIQTLLAVADGGNITGGQRLHQEF
jgi:hypothetical protein